MNAPKITPELRGIEYDVELLYTTKPLHNYEQRKTELMEQRSYATKFHNNNTKPKVFADLDLRIERLTNIINHKKEQEANAEGNRIVQQSV